MKTICLKPFNNKVFYRNRIFRINNGHNIFFNFDKKLLKKKIRIETYDLCRDPDVFVYCDVPYPWSLKQWLRIMINFRKNFLFCFESPLVNPFNHMKFLRVFFRKIYTWDSTTVGSKHYLKFNIPQLIRNRKIKEVSFKDKQFITMVNAKKSSLLVFRLLSIYRKDLYKERLNIIDYFEKNIPNEFHLYGWGWVNADPFKPLEKIFGFKSYKVYKGEIEDKLEVISHFKYCLAIENAEAPGYITEKIFDCFKSGCIPIYYGAPNISKYVPKSCFIDMRNFENYDDLLDYLKSIDEKRYKRYIKAAKDFLRSKKTLNTWFEKGFEKVFLNCISET